MLLKIKNNHTEGNKILCQFNTNCALVDIFLYHESINSVINILFTTSIHKLIVIDLYL